MEEKDGNNNLCKCEGIWNNESEKLSKITNLNGGGKCSMKQKNESENTDITRRALICSRMILLSIFVYLEC